MSCSPPPHSSHDTPQSSSTKCNPNTPSTSYYIPPKVSYRDAAEEQPTFLKSSTYGQISYEVDDTNSPFNYSYNPRRTFASQMTPSLPRYLEDTSYSGHGMLDAPPEYLLHNAPASVPPNFSYLSDFHESEHFISVQSPRDDAQFSTPDCAPDSVLISAPTSSEAHYIPSPTNESETSISTLKDSNQSAVIIVGQGAKKATLKDIESIRYESPKNHDQRWINNSFHLAPEANTSADDVELRTSSNGEDVTQIDTDESDGRVSMVDRLFAMLQRAERESSEVVTNDAGDEGFQERDAEMSQTTTSSSLPNPSASWKSQQTHCTSQNVQFIKISQDGNLQDISASMSHCSQRDNVSTAYVTNSFHSRTTEDPPFLSTVTVPSLPQYHSQYAFHQYSQEGNLEESLGRNPVASVAYNETPTYVVPHIQLQQQEPTYQYFQPIVTEPVSEAPLQNYPAMQFFYPSWNVSSNEEPPMLTLPQFVQQTGTETEPLQYFEPEENTDAAEYEERSRETISTYSESETEIGPFDSISNRQSDDQQTMNEDEEQPLLKGPPFEQKGPTRTKEIQPVPNPPPPSPVDVTRKTHLEGMDRSSLIEQLRYETDRLEDISLRKIGDYDREEELKDLCAKMNSRFQRFYPNLILPNDEDDIPNNALDEEVIEDGDPEDGFIMRNSVQLTTKYLALWFPEKKEREQMIPWNILRKVKPIRLCFLDNRIGHGEFENFNIGEFVSITGHMMFTYGDGPEALDETRLFVLDIVRQQMNMLLRRVWSNMVQKYQRRVMTYTNIFDLYKNHPIRLRRLVRYLIEQNRTRHMLYRVMADQGRRRGQHYIENRMGVNEKGATEVIFLRKRAPHIYYALSASYEDQLEFLCEERRIQDCDPDLANIKMFLKQRNRHLSEEHKELLNFARRVSYCSRTGRLSAFRAHRFHEFLGFPDLQTDLIYVLDFIAREIVMEVTYHAALIREQERQTIPAPSQGFLHQPVSNAKLAAESMELRHYEDGLRRIYGWRQNQDILFGEEECKVMLSYGKNPRKWESDNEYNKREAAERREFEDLRPLPRHTVYFTSAELFEEHKKVLRGEYWDSSPEDLTKEAFVLANTYAAARLAQVSVPQPKIPEKWKEQHQQDIKEEKERLDKLKALKHDGDQYNKLTKQLVKMMEKNTIHDSDTISNSESTVDGDGGPDVKTITKAIHEAVRRHKNFSNAQL